MLLLTWYVLSQSILCQLSPLIFQFVESYQDSFVEGRSTTDQFITLREFLEKCLEYRVLTHHLLIDFKPKNAIEYHGQERLYRQADKTDHDSDRWSPVLCEDIGYYRVRSNSAGDSHKVMVFSVLSTVSRCAKGCYGEFNVRGTIYNNQENSPVLQMTWTLSAEHLERWSNTTPH